MSLCSRRSRLSETNGQTLVEFSLSVLMLVMLLLGVFEICRMVLVYTTVSNAARIGVRYAMVHGSHNSASTGAIQQAVKNYLGPATVNTGNATVTVNYPDTGSCTNPGCRVTVSVSYPYNPFTTYFPIGSVTLSSTSQGVITF
jgi:Flp pilus assembly protein TadG